MIDTNLFVAAYWNRHSASAYVLQACLEGRVRLFYTDQIRREIFLIMRNIRASQPYHERVEAILAGGTRVDPTESVSVVADDPEDDKFIECALAAHAEYLVTSDDHLLRIGRHGDTEIIKPFAFRRVLAGA